MGYRLCLTLLQSMRCVFGVVANHANKSTGFRLSKFTMVLGAKKLSIREAARGSRVHSHKTWQGFMDTPIVRLGRDPADVRGQLPNSVGKYSILDQRFAVGEVQKGTQLGVGKDADGFI